jgi:hypothetical protein
MRLGRFAKAQAQKAVRCFNHNVIALAFLIPLLLWALAARTKRSGRTYGLALAVIAAVEIVVFRHLILQPVRITLLVLIPLATVIVLVTGLVADRRTGVRLTRRSRLGVVLSIICSAAAVPGVIVVFLVLLGHYPTQPPPDSEIEPLPAGLQIVQDTPSCTTQAADFCSRFLVIAGKPGVANTTVLAELRASLDARGLNLTYDGENNWQAAQRVGVLLDTHYESIDVGIDGQQVTADLVAGASS